MSPRLTTLLLVVGAFLWSTNYILASLLAGAVDPLLLTFLRWAAGAPLLVVAAWVIERPRLVDVLRQWPLLIVTAATGLVLYNLLNYQALRFTTPTDAAVVNSVNPVVIAVLASLTLGTRISRGAVIGIGLSLVGVVIVVSDGDLSALLARGVGPGQLLVLVAVLCWATYAVVGRRLTTRPLTSVAAQACLAAAALAPFAAGGVGALRLEPLDLLWLGLLVIFPTCIAFVLWNVGVARLGPARAGVFINTMPVFTAAMAFGLGIQPFRWSLVLGGAVVIAGVLLTTLPSRGRRAGERLTPP